MDVVFLIRMCEMFWDELFMMCGVICFGQFGRRKYQQNRRRLTGLTTGNSEKNWTEETTFRFLLRQPECATRQNIMESSVLRQRQIDKTDDNGENRHIDQNGLERRQYKIDCYWFHELRRLIMRENGTDGECWDFTPKGIGAGQSCGQLQLRHRLDFSRPLHSVTFQE